MHVLHDQRFGLDNRLIFLGILEGKHFCFKRCVLVYFRILFSFDSGSPVDLVVVHLF